MKPSLSIGGARAQRFLAGACIHALIVQVAAIAWGLIFAPVVRAEDLMQIYREALVQDPVLAAARATWLANQEALPQAQAGLLPSVSFGASLQYSGNQVSFKSSPPADVTRDFHTGAFTISASQPLYHKQNVIAVEEAKSTLGQSDFTLAQAQQDLIVRVAQAYFDVLLAQVTIELTESQKAAVSEQLAQAKRNFEVGTATITDTNEAQARYDQITAQGISAQNDLDNRIATLRSIIGRYPRDVKPLTRKFEPRLPEPNALDAWIERALQSNYTVRISQATYDIAVLEVERAKAAHYPTLDAVASYGYNNASGSVSNGFGSDTRSAIIGLQLAVPIYAGGALESRVRQALAAQENSRQSLEFSRRTASLNTQTAFTGVTSGEAQIRAFEQALISAQSSYDSNKLGQEVGVRTNLDVLNTQQQVYQTRRDLAQSYYNFILNVLRLKAAVGILSESDLELINRELG